MIIQSSITIYGSGVKHILIYNVYDDKTCGEIKEDIEKITDIPHNRIIIAYNSKSCGDDNKISSYTCKVSRKEFIILLRCNIPYDNVFNFLKIQDLNDKNFKRNEECIVCMENTPNYIGINCRHDLVICYDCKKRLNICPFCREDF